MFVSALITVGFAAWDTYQYASGKINGADYAVRMTVNGAALIADAASGGMGGGVAVRTAAIAARAGKAGAAIVKTATAINKANQIYGQAQAVESFAHGVVNGDGKQALFGAVGTYAAVKAHLPGKGGNVGRLGATSDDAAQLAQGETKLLQKEAQAAGQVEGQVEKRVFTVDPHGNAIPLKPGQVVEGRKDMKMWQVKDANGKPTGDRYDGLGHPKQVDPKAQVPHAHRVDEAGKPILDATGNPHLPANPPRS